ncbi:MAG TPA: PQQ-binding-like beta-propeller repeat protein [Candidatus Dormibacteraeota bacterium]|nr:PQQ-binding-like beta-propeller repeat protein [Candidatus Dormibacteraeota bacterium]
MEFAQKLIVVGLVLVACSTTQTTTASLDVAWRARLQGAVDGTPATANGTVFAGSAGGELAAFDERTGTTVWSRRGLGAISDSPAVDNSRVYAGTLSGHVLAFDARDGATLWDWTGPPNAAMWSSPVIYRDIVLIGVASPYGDTPLVPGRVVALDAATGAERWTMCLLAGCAPGDGVWSTVTIDAAGTAFVGIGNPGDGLLAFDPVSGRRNWLRSLYADSGRDFDVGARPVVVNSGARELVVVASVEGTLFGLDATTGDIVWSRKLVEGSAVHGLIASPAYDGTNLYVASASPPFGVFAVRPADGAVVWRHGTDRPIYSAPAVSGGKLVFGTGAAFGDLRAGAVLELATGDGHEIARLDVYSAVRGGPAVSGDLAIAGDYAGEILAVRLRT